LDPLHAAGLSQSKGIRPPLPSGKTG